MSNDPNAANVAAPPKPPYEFAR
ncbi:MAG: hypothetical protein Greene041662_819, partial [Candidatus Peregrinibacteria bacterium Greene0416_62]